jgi:hypothetical protein
LPERIEGSEPRNMLNTIAGRMRWSVLWYVPKKDKIVRHKCGNDLGEATRIYLMAKNAGKNQVTLRCDNTGFPPPSKYLPHMVYVKATEEYRTPKRKLKTRVVRKAVQRIPMDAANRKGIYWCPYCREFRRFQKQEGFYYDGIYVPDPDPRGGLYCPMCGISHRDMHVRSFNPIAERHFLTGGTSRGTRRPRRSV